MGCLISLPIYQALHLHNDISCNNYESDLYYQEFEDDYRFNLFSLND